MDTINLVAVSSVPAYPGAEAGAGEVLALARAYRAAARALFLTGDRACPLSLAPARFCAMHAIELCLNAFLRHEGRTPGQIRGRMHNLCDPAFAAALGLRRKTVAHLATLTERREMLISRYGPERTAEQSQENRLIATLEEVMTKVGRHPDQGGTVIVPPSPPRA